MNVVENEGVASCVVCSKVVGLKDGDSIKFSRLDIHRFNHTALLRHCRLRADKNKQHTHLYEMTVSPISGVYNRRVKPIIHVHDCMKYGTGLPCRPFSPRLEGLNPRNYSESGHFVKGASSSGNVIAPVISYYMVSEEEERKIVLLF